MKNQWRWVAVFACLLAPGLWLLWQEARDAAPRAVVHARSDPGGADPFGRLPLYFIENKGQIDPSVHYYLHQGGSSTFFTEDGVTFSMVGETESGDTVRWDTRLRFLERHAGTRLVADQKQAAVVSYFREPSTANAPTFGRLTYHEIWPGIDLVYSGSQGRLKYGLRVRPGADPARIRLSYEGIDRLRIDDTGALEVATGLGIFLDEAPTASQETGDGRRNVDVRFVLGERMGEYGFEVGEYDPRQTLIIDPVVLLYSGFIGGAGNDIGLAIALDGSDNAYISGSTTSVDFPVTIGPDLTFDLAGNRDAFVLKLSPSGTSLIYAGYLGGTDGEWAYGVDVDATGAAWVVGETLSTDFPTNGWPHSPGLSGSSEAFVAKVAPSGLNLVFSGYMGGTSSDSARDVAVDASTGEAYVTGLTSSTEANFLPTPSNPFGGLSDAFVVKFDVTGALRYAPFYIGTPGSDAGRGVDFDRGSGDALVAGLAEPGLPAPVNPHAGGAVGDAFVARVNNTGTGFVWTTYIGGTQSDQAWDIAVDGGGNTYVTGSTGSSDLPATGPQAVYGGGTGDAFVARLDPAAGIAYLTFLGGALGETAQGIDVDGLGNAYVTGNTATTEAHSPPFPIVRPGELGATHAGANDAFVTKIDPAGSSFLYSVYYGGSGVDVGDSLAVNPGGDVFFTGVTDAAAATLIPVRSANPIPGGGTDAFAARITTAPVTFYRSIGNLGPAAATVSVTSNSPLVTGSGTMWVTSNNGTGDVIVIAGVPYIVRSVESETSLTLGRPYMGATASGIAATIRRAFGTLAAWESCIDNSGPCPGPPSVFSNDLVLDDRNEVGLVYFDGPAIAGGVDINGPVTDENHRITLTAAELNRHPGIAAGAAPLYGFVQGAVIDNTGNSTPAINVRADHVTVEWLEITSGGSGAPGVQVAPPTPNNDISIHHMLIHHVPGDGIHLASADLHATIYDNIIYTSTRGIRQSVSSNAGSWIGLFNNTVFGCTFSGFDTVSVLQVINLSNNIATTNGFPDFNVAAFDPASTNNLSTDASAPGANRFSGVPLGSIKFVSAGPPENFHLVPTASVAEDNGADLTAYFTTDIDGLGRVSPWDIGADEARTTTASGASLSSAKDQTFVVGAPPAFAATITVVDFAGGSVTAANDLRIRIPASLDMRWNPAAAPSFVGKAAGKVNGVLPYEDGDKTLVIDVTASFAASDDLRIDGLGFQSFVAPSPPSVLELDLTNSGGSVIAAADDHTLRIVPASTPQISSDADQQFLVLDPDTLIAPVSISDATTPNITAVNDIRITIPGSLAMTWSNVVSSYGVSGPASGKVNSSPASVSFEDSFKTVVIDVTTNFQAGDSFTLTGLFFTGFGTPSGPDHLQVEVFNDGVVNDTDDKNIVIGDILDIPVFTVRSADGENLLQWRTPASGLYAATRVLRRDDGLCPVDENDGTVVVNQDNGLDALGSFTDLAVTNDRVAPNAYYAYRAFVDAGGGRFSGAGSAPCVTARPFTVGPASPVRWVFNMTSTALATPGVGASGGTRLVYVPSNDGSFYALVGGDGGGNWFPGYVPPRVNVVQHRPPVIPYGTGAASKLAYLSSQDGHVYAIDAENGAVVWDKTTSTSALTAAPSGLFTGFGSSDNLVFVGTREGLPGGDRFEALEVDNLGNTAWSFVNSSASPDQSGNDARIGAIQSGAAVDYATDQIYFGSQDSGDAGSSTIWAITFSGTASDDDVDLLWSRNIGNVSGSPILHGGVLYVGNDNGDVYAFDKDTGAELWGPANPIATGAGRVNQFVFPEFGTVNLLFSTAGNPTPTVWSAANNGGGHSVNWSNNTLGVVSTPLYVPGTLDLFVGSDARRLIRVTTDNLTQSPLMVGESSIDEQLGMPTFDVVQHMLYVGTDAGKVYAIAYDLFP